MSQQARDAAYDNLLAVVDSSHLIDARVAASARFRDRHRQCLDISYGPRPRNRWDLFPQKDNAAPCLVFIHGGYWQRNRHEDFAAMATGVHQRGWAAALPGYTLAPEASLTEIAAEIRLALDWLAAHGASHGIKGPLILSGWSAGAHLAALALDHPAITAGLAISGVFELGPLRDTYLNEKLHLSDNEVEQLSPLRLAPVAKPMAIAYGSKELPALIKESRDLHAWRAAAHRPGPLVPVAGADHFSILQALQSPHGDLTEQLLSLVR
ncbi:MAG TPA: alpha/beta hydrolase [Alphaproteobacteria bacterium]|nr:alpha/beta hydrolase [Alphaproteobacteria bacterium]